MGRKRKPLDLGLSLTVNHVDSLPDEFRVIGTDPDGKEIERPADSDGHHIGFGMVSFRGECLVEIMVRRGIAKGVASGILRKLADHIDKHGDILLNMKVGNDGEFDSKGDPAVFFPNDEFENWADAADDARNKMREKEEDSPNQNDAMP